jgi:predicted membrane-bound mannosyltransferase
MPHLLVGLATWLLVATTLLSGFYTNPHGLWDSVLTYLPWLERAGGDTPHVHPALFYWERLFWFSDGTGLASTELLLAVLAGVGAVVAVRKRGYGDARLGWLRFILIYTLVLGALYSSIPYKTPWCVLGVVQGLTLLGGAGAAALFRSVRRPVFRLGLGVALGVLLGHLGWQAWSLSQTRASDRGNPWAYAATSEDIENLVAQVERIAASHPRGHGMDLQVACAEDDYWPLPFSLRAFSQVGWWSQVPPPPWAPVLIVSPAFGPDVEATGNTVNAGYYQLRPGVFRLLYVDRDLWTRVVAGGARGVRQVEGALEDP